MEYRESKGRILLKVKKGESPIDALKKLATEKRIYGGAIIGIGAITNPKLSYYNTESKKYEAQQFQGEYELLSCVGNFAIKENEIFCHLHVTLGSHEFKVIGGHLDDCTVSGTVEFFIFPSDKVVRKYDSETGLYIWDFNESINYD